MSEYPLEIKFKTQEKMVLVLQTIVSCVFGELAKDPDLGEAIKRGFDNAALSAEVLALKMGKSERDNTALDALQIIEDFRAITFGEK
jgi:hypothetical protein